MSWLRLRLLLQRFGRCLAPAVARLSTSARMKAQQKPAHRPVIVKLGMYVNL